MRRIGAYVLVALGSFCLVFAALLRFYAVPRLARAPLDQYSTSRSVAENATYLDSGALAVRTGQTLVAERIVRGDVAGAQAHEQQTGRNVGVWDVLLTIDNADTGALVSAVQDRYAFDRRSQEAVDCCEAAVDGIPVRHQGIEYKFPFDAQKKTYRYFDLSLHRATDMRFVGEDTVKGLHVYKYVQQIAPEKIATLDVPGSLLGLPAASVPADRMYANTRTVWVEPTSGIIVKGAENQHSTLEARGASLTITDARLEFDDATVSDFAKKAQDARSSVRLISTLLPIGLLIIGGILLAAGLLLVRPWDDDRPNGSDTAHDETLQPVG